MQNDTATAQTDAAIAQTDPTRAKTAARTAPSDPLTAFIQSWQAQVTSDPKLQQTLAANALANKQLLLKTLQSLLSAAQDSRNAALADFDQQIMTLEERIGGLSADIAQELNATTPTQTTPVQGKVIAKSVRSVKPPKSSLKQPSRTS